MDILKTLIPTGPATALLPVEGKKPVTVIGTENIRKTFSEDTLQQIINTRLAPGVEDVVLNPDAHIGYGAPIGCVMTSGSHIYPGPVGVDIKCSMSLLQLNIPADAIKEQTIRRAIINAIVERVPTGAGRGQRHVPKSRHVSETIGRDAVVRGAQQRICRSLNIPLDWIGRCEDSFHCGHDESVQLYDRLDALLKSDVIGDFPNKVSQLGSYGGGNHFGECSIVHVCDDERSKACAAIFGLLDGHVAFLSHCGSRGFGHNLASNQFRILQKKFSNWSIPFPGNDKELCYAPLGTQEANDYLDDMSMGANFATVNHLLINALVLEAFQEVLPGTTGQLVYFISHNIARQEIINNRSVWVMRKGATRAYPAGHHSLKGTMFEHTGHPILLPGDPIRGSAVMVADPGAEASCFSINHGAGRILGRKQAKRTLNQRLIDQTFAVNDVMTNCRTYPIDESPDAYKDFFEVLRSVNLAGLATQIAKLKARFVIKDHSGADD